MAKDSNLVRSAQMLKIATMFVGKKNAYKDRLALTGIHIERTKTAMLMVATDGHKLCIQWRHKDADALFKLLCVSHGAEPDGNTAWLPTRQSKEQTLPDPYPKWRNVVPMEFSCASPMPRFDPHEASVCKEAITLLGGGQPNLPIAWNSEIGCTLFAKDANAEGGYAVFCMPVRCSEESIKGAEESFELPK